ncbi:MAG: hypothetical protein WCT49_00720 [Candidatus Paceibacterota bacterium]|jgi:hypothetical protein|nr:hypothetical protein [Candidatus Paceibacterota bacterium]
MPRPKAGYFFSVKHAFTKKLVVIPDSDPESTSVELLTWIPDPSFAKGYGMAQRGPG